MNRAPDLRFAPGARRRLRQAAEAAYPLEACGALLGDDGLVTGIHPLPNRATRPDLEYRIAPAELEPLMRAEGDGGGTVLGFYHSHPDSGPAASAADVARAWPGYWYVIVGVRDGVATSEATWRSTDA